MGTTLHRAHRLGARNQTRVTRATWLWLPVPQARGTVIYAKPLVLRTQATVKHVAWATRGTSLLVCIVSFLGGWVATHCFRSARKWLARAAYARTRRQEELSYVQNEFYALGSNRPGSYQRIAPLKPMGSRSALTHPERFADRIGGNHRFQRHRGKVLSCPPPSSDRGPSD